MKTAFAQLLAIIAPVFVVVACGFVMRRTGKLRPEADSSLFTIAINFLYPCLIMNSVLRNQALREPLNVVVAPVVGAALLLGCFAVAMVVGRLMKLNRPQPFATFAFTAALPNWGYLPIPIIRELCGERAVGVLFVHNIGMELVLWSVGVQLLTGSGSWRRALTVPFFAILAALVLNLFHAGDWLPEFFLTSLEFIGKAALPLSILLTGVGLADAVADGGVWQHFRTTLAGCAVRMAILPPLILCAAKWLPLSLELKQVLVIQAAMPSAMLPLLLTRSLQGDSGTAMRIVVASTLLGLVTIPLWIRFGAYFVGV